MEYSKTLKKKKRMTNLIFQIYEYVKILMVNFLSKLIFIEKKNFFKKKIKIKINILISILLNIE